MAISVDSAEHSQRLARELDIEFPLLRDADLSVADRYGVAMRDEEIAIPAVFIVATDGTIRWRKVGETMVDRPTADAILEQLDALR